LAARRELPLPLTLVWMAGDARATQVRAEKIAEHQFGTRIDLSQGSTFLRTQGKLGPEGDRAKPSARISRLLSAVIRSDKT
jgi:hypothetical protein